MAARSRVSSVHETRWLKPGSGSQSSQPGTECWDFRGRRGREGLGQPHQTEAKGRGGFRGRLQCQLLCRNDSDKNQDVTSLWWLRGHL